MQSRIDCSIAVREFWGRQLMARLNSIAVVEVSDHPQSCGKGLEVGYTAALLASLGSLTRKVKK